jgi:predicted aspartyl protease
MSLTVEVEIESTDTAVRRRTQALIDCGATGCFIDIEWAKLDNIPTRPLTNPIPVHNFDSTANDTSAITDIADIILHYEHYSERTQLAITRLGKQSLILGYNWLQNHNPEINWQTKNVKCLTAHYNAPLVEWKISAMQKYGSQRRPRSMHAGQEHYPRWQKRTKMNPLM